jgi:tRNA U34 5-carboxymethylaminomethyl modifying enzyme MnmG/GidA
MKVLLGSTIVLLALVSVGLAVYAYNEHREVAYLTLRADHLERRINEIEANAGMAEGEEVERLEARVRDLERAAIVHNQEILNLTQNLQALAAMQGSHSSSLASQIDRVRMEMEMNRMSGR